MVFKNRYILVLWRKLPLALEGLRYISWSEIPDQTIWLFLVWLFFKGLGAGDFENACPKQQFQNFGPSRFSSLLQNLLSTTNI